MIYIYIYIYISQFLHTEKFTYINRDYVGNHCS
jgi:hypothetical protein